MLTSVEILDRLAQSLGDASDYRVAKELGVSKTTVSNWRVGKGGMSDDNAIRVAELLGEDPKFILACVLAERSKSKKAKQVLQQIADSFKRTAAALVLEIAVFTGFFQPTPARAAVADSPVMYILLSWIRRLKFADGASIQPA